MIPNFGHWIEESNFSHRSWRVLWDEYVSVYERDTERDAKHLRRAIGSSGLRLMYPYVAIIGE